MNPLFPEWDQAQVQEGIRRRDEAMARVAEHAIPSWTEHAEHAVYYVARRRGEMTTDPVWTLLEHWGVPAPPEPRALGPIMKKACGWGWLEPTGRTHKSVRPDCHRRPLAVYASRLFRA